MFLNGQVCSFFNIVINNNVINWFLEKEISMRCVLVVVNCTCNLTTLYMHAVDNLQ